MGKRLASCGLANRLAKILKYEINKFKKILNNVSFFKIIYPDMILIAYSLYLSDSLFIK